MTEQSAGADNSIDRPERVAARLSRLYLDAVRVADAGRALRVATTGLAEGMTAPELYQRVITPAMHQVGILWEKGALTVADEHMATALTHRVLAALRPPFGTDPRESPPALTHVKRRAMLAAVEGEQHALGLRMAADLLEDAGFHTFYLGADVPTAALVQAVSSLAPDLVALSVTMPEFSGQLERAVGELRQAHPRLELLIGGQGASPRVDGGTLVSDLEVLPAWLSAPPQM